MLRVFALLGVTSFGGPVAHLGYFRAELVDRRRWLTDRQYADLVALCQVLPGPASSQVGFALGLLRAGTLGALAAFVAFTLPSALLLAAFGLALAAGADLLAGPVATGILDGLQIVAVAIVAHAVWGMARTLTPDARRAGIAAAALVAALALPGATGQLTAIAVGALAGMLCCRPAADAAERPPAASDGAVRVPRRVGAVCLVLLAGLLLLLPLLARLTGDGTLLLADTFFRAGALVFGGGHVVLPLLEAGVVDTGWVRADTFLAGYGAAQAMPGPLFTFAAFLGAVSTVGPGGIAGAAVATIAIFAPGFLLLVGALPFFAAVQRTRLAPAAFAGVGAAVVGILAAALYTPVFTSGVTGTASFALAAVCFVLLTALRTPAWAVVLIGAAGGTAIALAGW